MRGWAGSIGAARELDVMTGDVRVPARSETGLAQCWRTTDDRIRYTEYSSWTSEAVIPST
jgi:hypothetical protein